MNPILATVPDSGDNSAPGRRSGSFALASTESGAFARRSTRGLLGKTRPCYCVLRLDADFFHPGCMSEFCSLRIPHCLLVDRCFAEP